MASDNEVERLVVTLEADYKAFLKEIDHAVQEAVKKLKETDEAPKKAKSAWQELGSFLGGKFLGIITAVGAAIVAAFSVQAVTAFFSAIAKGMIDTNKQFETFEVQFESLLGSTSEAKKRIDELAKFGVETPFQLDEIVQANRLMQTFGGNVLASNEEMRKMGDAAASVSAPIGELAMWWGRLYDAIKSGRPMGEALMRMQELGLVSGDLRGRLEDAQKAGEDWNKIWAMFTDEVGQKSAGAMDKLSKTLGGLISNLNDFREMLLRKGGEGLFEGLKGDAEEFYEIINQPEIKEALIELAKALGSVIDSFREAVTSPILDGLKEIDPETVNDLAESVQDISEAVGRLTGIDIGNLEDIVKTLDGMAQAVATLVQGVANLKDRVDLLNYGMGAAGEAGVEFSNLALGGVFSGLSKVNKETKELTGSSISEWAGGVKKDLDDVATAGENAFSKLQEGARKAAEGAKTPEVTPIDDPKAREMYEKSAKELRELQEKLGEEREEIEQEHGERIIEINEDYQEAIVELEADTAEKRAEIVKDAADELAKLEKDGAKERLEIAKDTAEALAELESETADARAEAESNARESLADLEADTQDEISKVRQEGQEREREETEDHQREMARLQQNYLLDLEGAVANRDARAIVDLRRKYQQEKREREEDFQTQRNRAREETEKRVEEAREAERERREEIEKSLAEELEQIEENEREKKQEILSSQEERLQALAEKEAERKAQIEADQAEELAKLQESEAKKKEELAKSLDEKLAKEEEHHAESLAALDEALQKWQEKNAEAWAEIEGITDEGVKAAFAAMEEVFGEDGAADKMWDAYFERLQQKAADMAEFNQQLAQSTSPTAPMAPTGQGGTVGEDQGGAGLPEFAQGGIVPGPRGRRRIILAHAGELVIPPEQTAQWMSQQGQVMAQNLGDSQKPIAVEITLKGSAPPGIGGNEMEQFAGVIVQAFNEAGIRARRK